MEPAVSYLLVLPIWLLIEAVLAVLWFMSRPDQQLWRLYLRSILFWSSLGFIVANICYATSAGWALHEFDSPAFKTWVTAWMLLGPVLCSAAGFTGGTLAGIFRAGRRARREEWDELEN